MQYLFSIIIPVFNVESLVKDCINSVLTQSGCDVEIIIINDASTDNSSLVIEEFKCLDNVVIIHSSENVGLGLSRNKGLDVAKGEYILFLDSDDCLTEGLIDLLKTKIGPDVIIFNHYRQWPSGKKVVNSFSKNLNNLSKETLSAHDKKGRVEVFNNLNVAWNKAYKKEFLYDKNMTFKCGYYEDISFNYKCIIEAKDICITDFLGYQYNQREGSILNSKSDKHIDIMRQYREAFAYSKQKNIDYFKKILSIFVNHIFNLVVFQRNRLTKYASETILSQAKILLKEYSSDLNSLSVSEKIKLKFLLLGKYAPVKLASNILSLKKRFLNLITPVFIKKIALLPKYIIYKSVFNCLKLKPNLVVFESYWGRSYSCNPKFISQYLEDKNQFELVWFGDSKTMEVGKAKYCQKYTLKYFYYIARAKFLVSNANFPNMIVKRSGSIHIQTKHGTPFKLMGIDELVHKNQKELIPDLLKRINRWDYVLSSNAYSTDIWKRSFPGNYEVLNLGYPRNDPLFYNNNVEYIKRIKSNVIPEEFSNRKIVLYMPTFRESYGLTETEKEFDIFQNEDLNNYVFLVRNHYFNGKNSVYKNNNIVDVTNYYEVSDLYLLADVLITDYSSAMYDFLLLDKPIVQYIPDYNNYLKSRGAYYDLYNNRLGEICNCVENLFSSLVNHTYEHMDYKFIRAEFKKNLKSFDDGESAIKIYNSIFKIVC